MNMKLEYDSISPITNNLCVIEEVDENTGETAYMCMESGWATTEQMQIGSDAVDRYESHCTELMKAARVNDETRGLVWYPAFVQFPNVMLYCTGTSPANLKWEISEIVPILESEREMYPVPGNPGKFFESRIDVDNSKQFDKLDFETALDEVYTIVQRGYNEHQDQLRDNGL